LLITALGVALSATVAARAERIVLRDGTSLETRGPWTVKGRLVVFHTAKGELASLRRAEVDEAATALANQPAVPNEAAPAAKPAPKTDVLVLKEDDLPKVTPRVEDAAAVAAGDGKTAAPEGGTDSSRRQPIEVGNWERVAAADGASTEILGTLRNRGDRVTEILAVKVVVLDAAGKVVTTVNAQPGKVELPPLESTGFSALLPDLAPDAFSALRFEVVTRPLRDEGAPPDQER
jgi:hypothetical protein